LGAVCSRGAGDTGKKPRIHALLIEDQEADMQFIELATKRYSVRSYRANPVEDDELQSVLQAARLAPTAANRQAFRLIVILTKNRESELLRIYNKSWFVQAPVVICICAIPNEAWVRSDGKNYSDVDAAIVMDHLVLAAADLGLGTCWIGAFDPVAAREVLGIPEQAEPIAFTPLGYPADQSRAKKRKSLDDLVKHNHW
jgi:nitroreductase